MDTYESRAVAQNRTPHCVVDCVVDVVAENNMLKFSGSTVSHPPPYPPYPTVLTSAYDPTFDIFCHRYLRYVALAAVR
jgi:hypothetical protein